MKGIDQKTDSSPPPILLAGAVAVADSGFSLVVLSLIPVTLAASYLSTSTTPSYLPQTNPIEPLRKTVPDKFTVPMAKLFQAMSDLAISHRIFDSSKKLKPPPKMLALMIVG
jgi:hypothetical protein